MRASAALLVVTACASPTRTSSPPRAPEPAPASAEPGALGASEAPAPIRTEATEAPSPRDTRKFATTPRSRALLVTEIQALERLLQATPSQAHDRPVLVHRLAEGYVELRYAAERDGADAHLVQTSRQRAVELYALLAREYPNYGRLDHVLYYAGYEHELGGALTEARALYRELARRFPSSGFLARIPPHLLDAR